MAVSDLYAQALLGQVGQAGQRQDPRRALASRLLAGSPPAAPLNSTGSVLAYALSEGLNAFAGDRMQQQAENQDEKRRLRTMGELRGYQDEERQRLAAITAGLYSAAPAAPATPAQEAPAMPSAPPSGPVTGEPLPAPQAGAGGDPRALNAEAARRRDEVLANTGLTPEQQAAALAEVSAWRASAGGTPPMAGGYRANQGVGGVFAGIAPPSGDVPAVMPGGRAPAGAAPSQQPAAAPGAMQPNMAVLQRMMASGDPQLMQQAQGVIALMRAQQQSQGTPRTITTAEGVFSAYPDGRRVREGDRPEAAPYSNLAQKQALERAQAGAARSTVNLPGQEATYDRERQQSLAAATENTEQAGARAAASLRRLDMIDQLLEATETGAFSSLRITGGQIAGQLGVSDDALRRFGMSRDQVAQAESLRGMTSELLQGLIGPGGFPAANFSNADREMLERALPGLANSPAGNRLMVQVARAKAQRELQISNAWNAYVRENGDSAQTARRFNNEVRPRLAGQDVLEPILKDFLSNMSGPSDDSIPGPGGVGRASPPPAPVRVQTPEQARRLPSGTPIILPDGTQGTVP